jgi:hypothetical protein
MDTAEGHAPHNNLCDDTSGKGWEPLVGKVGKGNTHGRGVPVSEFNELAKGTLGFPWV